MASIEKTDNQRWRARYRDPSGRSRSRTFSTKAEAQRFLNGVGADMQRGQWVDPALGTTKLSTWVEEFLRTAHDLDPSTRATYDRDLRRYVLPRFGDTPMCRINKLDVRSWINDELGQGLAASSVHRHFRTLRRVLTWRSSTNCWPGRPASASAARGLRPRRCGFSTPGRSSG